MGGVGIREVGIPGGELSGVDIPNLEGVPPMRLTSSDGHQNTYGRQVGSTHPTGILHCFFLKFIVLNSSS